MSGKTLGRSIRVVCYVFCCGNAGGGEGRGGFRFGVSDFWIS